MEAFDVPTTFNLAFGLPHFRFALYDEKFIDRAGKMAADLTSSDKAHFLDADFRDVQANLFLRSCVDRYDKEVYEYKCDFNMTDFTVRYVACTHLLHAMDSTIFTFSVFPLKAIVTRSSYRSIETRMPNRINSYTPPKLNLQELTCEAISANLLYLIVVTLTVERLLPLSCWKVKCLHRLHRLFPLR